VVVVFNGTVIADTRRALRVLETSHPPNYYIPPDDILMDRMVRKGATSWCEWKGRADYFDVVDGKETAEKAAWCYDNPTSGFERIRHHLAFYAGRVDACFVDGERVTPQPGGFYGGWITRRIVGPFKGVAASMFW